ncbi:MAG: chemotaxis protein CheW [Woeseiaceae bacterium]
MQSAEQQITEPTIRNVGEQYLTFLLDREEYAVEILKVQEIKSWSTVTPVPCAPEYILGVINLRGAIVPVIDLRSRFGLEHIDHTPSTAVIIVRATNSDQQRIAGLVVDEVAEVYHLQESNIQDSVDIAGSIDGDYIRGLAQAEENLVILINLDRIIMSSLELADLAEIVTDD